MEQASFDFVDFDNETTRLYQEAIRESLRYQSSSRRSNRSSDGLELAIANSKENK